MPILQNAKKALRASQRKQGFNTQVKSRMKNAVAAVQAEPTTEKVTEAYRRIDRAAKKHIINRHKAARLKSHVSNLLSN